MHDLKSKKIFSFYLSLSLLFLFAFGLAACEEHQDLAEKKLFTGEWKIVSMARYSTQDQSFSERRQLPLEDAFISFQNDGTYLQNGLKIFEPRSGTWNTFADGKKIVFNKQTDEEFVVDIVEINPEHISFRIIRHFDVLDRESQEIRIETQETILELIR